MYHRGGHDTYNGSGADSGGRLATDYHDRDGHHGYGGGGGGSSRSRGRSSASDNTCWSNGGSVGAWERGGQSSGARGVGHGRGGGGGRGMPNRSGHRNRRGGGNGHRRQDHYYGDGGAQTFHPYSKVQTSRDRCRNQLPAPATYALDGRSTPLKRPKLKEEDTEDDMKVNGDDTDMVDDTDNCISLEEKVTPETWESCSWDEKIASQHPDFHGVADTMTKRKIGNKTYLRPGGSIKNILAPFGWLKDECRTDEWFERKKEAAKRAFAEGWEKFQKNEDNEFDSCQLNESEVKQFFDALPYNMVFLVGFDVLGTNPNDAKHCLCPCSSKCAKWRKQFGLNDIMDNCEEVDNCGNTFKSSEPHGLMQHLKDSNRRKKGLHLFVQLYVEELYGPPYCGNVGHKGLYRPGDANHKAAEAFEKRMMCRKNKKLTADLETEKKEKEKLEKAVKQHEKDFKELEIISKDLAQKLKTQEENARILNVDLSKMKDVENKLDAASLKKWEKHFQSIFRAMKWAVESGSRGKIASVNVPVSQNFTLEEFFEKHYETTKKLFLFKPIGSDYENVGGKIIRDWNVVFDTSEVTKIKSVKQEIQEIDEGGPSRHFMSMVWKTLHKVKVTGNSNDGATKSLDLFYREEDTGYSLLQADAKIESFLESLLPGKDREAARKKIHAYYQAIGRLFLHALSTGIKIPCTLFPPLFRQYLLRNCKPGDKDYPHHEVLRDVATVGFNFKADQIIGTTCDTYFGDDDNEPITNETFYSKYLLKACIGSRSIAIEHVSLGLTLKDDSSLDDNFPITTIFSVMPSTALDVIVFADDGYESAEDVIDFLKPKYCSEVLVINQTGSPDYQKLETDIIESQKTFFEETLPNLLRDIHKAEKSDKEMYAELTRKRKDFLSLFVHYATGTPHLPNPDLMEERDKITIEFNKDATEATPDSLPVAHTCENTLKFPHFAYENDADRLMRKLRTAFNLCDECGAFGMA